MELDDAYANGKYVEGSEAFPSRWQEMARAFVASIAGRQRIGLPYGRGARERFDLFYPEGKATGVLIFVHGGYWLRFDKSYWSHLARGALLRGWAVAMPSYDLCPQARIADITRQIANAVEVIAAMVPGKLALAGHSAGGHLVARMLTPGLLDPDVAMRLQRVVPISPVADLRPLLKTSMNADLGLTAADAAAESPVLQPRPETPVTVWVGGSERPAFLEQARALAAAWAVPVVVVPDKHHFDVIDALADPGSDLVETLVSG